MKKRISAFVLASAALLFVSGSVTPKAKAGPARETHYTVHYACIIGPPPPDVVGEWVEDCDGNWTGWGMMPGDGCTTTTETPGARCFDVGP